MSKVIDLMLLCGFKELSGGSYKLTMNDVSVFKIPYCLFLHKISSSQKSETIFKEIYYTIHIEKSIWFSGHYTYTFSVKLPDRHYRPSYFPDDRRINTDNEMIDLLNTYFLREIRDKKIEVLLN